MDVVTESSHARIVVRQGNDPLRPVVGSQSEGVSSGGRADLDYPHNSRQSLGISSSGSQLETGVPSERSMRHYSGVSENSVTSSSPFGDDFEESSVVRGGEDIGLAGHDSLRGGWLAHASTECLTGNGTGNLAHQGNQSYAKTLEDASNSFSMAASPGSGRNSKFSQPSGDADEAEARQIKQNLERWAAAERQRRKAARSSRTGSLIVAGDAQAPTLAKKLSVFGRKGTAGPLLPEPRAPTASHNLLIRASAANSISSSDSYASDGTRPGGTANRTMQMGTANPHSHADRGLDLTHSVVLSEEAELASPALSSDLKGKARAMEDDRGPFSDPVYPTNSSSKRRSVKPMATFPIVTPGRAPSIRRTPAGMPSIIATDADAPSTEPNDTRGSGASANVNPFLSSNEIAAPTNVTQVVMDSIHEEKEKDGSLLSPTQRYVFTRKGSSDTMMTTASLVRVRQPANSSRMSISKFLEIGLENEEEDRDRSVSSNGEARRFTGEDDSGRSRHRRIRSQILGEDEYEYGTRSRAESEAQEDRQRLSEGNGRQPWWTEWICGCGRVVDEDNEQTGKTGPE